MKKFLSFILVTCMLILASVTMAACKENPPANPPAPVVVTIGANSYNYDTLQEAIVLDETTEIIKIKLNQNLTLNEWFYVSVNEYELDLNGYNISVTEDFAKNGLFIVGADAKLTFKGNGIINSATQGNDSGIAVWAYNGGEVIINGGTFTNVNSKAVEDNGTTPNNNDLIYSSQTSTITINGGTFIGNYENSANGTKYTLNKRDADRETCTLIVKGGTFKNFNPADNLAEGEGTNFVATGFVSTPSTVDGATWYTVTAQ